MKVLGIYSLAITILLPAYHLFKFSKKSNKENKENEFTLVALIPVVAYLFHAI